MRDLKVLKNLVMGAALGLMVLVGSAVTASAQNVSREYQQWQRAQQRVAVAYQRYLRTRRPSDYRAWQNAQVRVQREYQQYQRAMARANNRYNDGRYYGDRGYYNNSNYGYPSTYRVYRNGRYYNYDSRSVELLRSAVQQGYAQGYRQGQIDRQYRRSYSYGRAPLYRSGTYGWQSYVPRNEYQYYYQQGFQRGYEDGFYTRHRYGVRSGNGFNILAGVLNTILRIVD